MMRCIRISINCTETVNTLYTTFGFFKSRVSIFS
nr:unnamed protein product [Callosobruchus analis]